VLLLLRHNSTTWVSERFLHIFLSFIVQKKTLIPPILMGFLLLLNQVSPEILCTRGVPLVARRRPGGRRESVCPFIYLFVSFSFVSCLSKFLYFDFVVSSFFMFVLGFSVILNITMFGILAWFCFRIGKWSLFFVVK